MRFLSRRPGLLPSNGWTTFTDTDGTAVYVSQSAGSNSNNGLSSGAPKQTLAAAMTVLNGLTNNMPHRLYLKAGDTWTDENIGQLKVSGRSSTEPLLISSYGAGARPLIKVAADTHGVITNGGAGGAAGGNYVAIKGLEFYAYTRDPANGGAAGTSTASKGLTFLNRVDWMLVEDCKFSFFQTNIEVDSHLAASPSTYVNIRRNIITDAYEVSPAHSQGIFLDTIVSPLVEENALVNNGWNATVSGAEGTVFNHNLYIKQTCGQAIVRRNISAYASAHGLQLRNGGTADDNLIVRCPLGILAEGDGDFLNVFVSYAHCTNNVILEGCDVPIDGSARAWGIDFVNGLGAGVYATGNIIANHASALANNGHGFELKSGCSGINVSSNIIYNWPTSGIIDSGSGNTKTSNKIDLNADDVEGYAFPAPTRSVGSYFGTQGQTATLAAFLAWHRARSAGSWTDAYGANAVNNYIRAGFGLSAV